MKQFNEAALISLLAFQGTVDLRRLKRARVEKKAWAALNFMEFSNFLEKKVFTKKCESRGHSGDSARQNRRRPLPSGLIGSERAEF